MIYRKKSIKAKRANEKLHSDQNLEILGKWKKNPQKLITVHLIFSSWYSANKFGVRAKRLSHDFYAGLAKKKTQQSQWAPLTREVRCLMPFNSSRDSLLDAGHYLWIR